MSLMSSPTSSCPLRFCRFDAASKLKLLHSGGWLGRQTVAVEVQFTLFSPAPNLFTSVTMLAEQSPTGVLLPSAKVQSVRVYRTPAVCDYVVMVCQVKCYITFLTVNTTSFTLFNTKKNLQTNRLMIQLILKGRTSPTLD